jgi:hypothetical protein
MVIAGMAARQARVAHWPKNPTHRSLPGEDVCDFAPIGVVTDPAGE